MANRPCSFLHAGDFHLERPLAGLAEVPEYFRAALIDAPYDAARRVFDTALKHRVDFLLLAGDIADARKAGPRAIVFLQEQLDRLAQEHLEVYWVAGAAEGEQDWPTLLERPTNLRYAPAEHRLTLVHLRDQEPLAQLFLVGDRPFAPTFDSELEAQQEGVFTIGVANDIGHVAPGHDALVGRPVRYWALGGQHARQTLGLTPSTIHYPGSPQGRGPAELGAHGCTLAQVDEGDRIRSTFIPTDRVRWQHERIEVTSKTTREQFDAALDQRIQALLTAGPDLDYCVEWTVSGAGQIERQLRSSGLAAEVLGRLRPQYGQRSPGLWSLSLEVERPVVASAELYDQDTLVGEFLRTLRRWQADDAAPIPLADFLSDHPASADLVAALSLANTDVRDETLRQASHLGLDLLVTERT